MNDVILLIVYDTLQLQIKKKNLSVLSLITEVFH